MSKYTETPLSAEQYQRCYRISIANPYHAPPVVTFEEEQIIKRADGSVLHDVLPAVISKQVTDFTEVFPVYDPTTQIKTGQTVGIAQVYAMIWSVYMFEATKRDAQKAKDAVLTAFEATSMQGMAAAMAEAKAVRDAFADQDVADLAQLSVDMAAATTPESKAACQYAYDIARSGKSAAAEAQANNIVNSQMTLAETQRAQAILDAQAAYDAVMAG